MEVKAHGQSLSIDTHAGAAITYLTLKSEHQTRTIISPKEGYHFQSSLLFPFPNRLENGQFKSGGRDFSFPLNDFGRPNALHGLIYDFEFEVIQQLGDKVTLRLEYTGDSSSYPFPFCLDVVYTLLPGKLDVEVFITNTGEVSMPCGFGWHPYFDIEQDDVKMLLRKVDKIEIDEQMIPTGKRTPYKTFEEPAFVSETQLDTCFRYFSEGINSATLFFPDGSQLEVWQDENQPFVQVFTPEDGRTIAIEPMTCGINALNSGEGLKHLSPGESWAFEFGLTLK